MSGLRAFKDVADETEPTVGEEVGRAIAPAIEAMSEAVARIGAQHTVLVSAISKAMTEALNAVDSKQIVLESQQVKVWDFKFERDSNLLLTRIVATAKG